MDPALSAADFETYLHQVAIACGGGLGIAVGRAVWQEAVRLETAARLPFLFNTARQRLERLQRCAPPWRARSTISTRRRKSRRMVCQLLICSSPARSTRILVLSDPASSRASARWRRWWRRPR